MVISGAIDLPAQVKFDRQKFRQIVSLLGHVRVFVPENRPSTRATAARLIPAPDSARIFERLVKSSLPYTVLANRVDEVDEEILALRESFSVPHKWRVDDIVATYSAASSGIGFHAGHEDALIVQAAGKRRWRVWGDETVPDTLKKRILLSEKDDIYSFEKTPEPPLIDCELNAGDALYIPPFFPHQGDTIEESFSIALAWRGVAYFHILDAFSEELSFPSNNHGAELPLSLFGLLPDRNLEDEQPWNLVIDKLEKMGVTIRDKDKFRGSVIALYGG